MEATRGARDLRAAVQELLAPLEHAAAHGALPFLGIDPGTQGAVCGVVVRRPELHRHHLRLGLGFEGLEDEQNHDVLLEVCIFVRELGGRAAIELVGPRPHDGARAAFSFGANFSWMRAAVRHSELACVEVAPQKWQRDLGLLGSGRSGKKKLLAERASSLWPDWTFTASGKRGIADAALVASWCATRFAPLVLPEQDLGW